MSVLELTPEQHLIEACEALDGITAYPDAPYRVEMTASLSAYATAHLLAAQVKMELNKDPYGDPRAWHGDLS